MFFHPPVLFCPWALVKMFENSGFEKQLVANSLSAFFLSLAVFEYPVEDLYPLFISSPQKQQLHACATAICYASPNILGGIMLYREL